MTLVNLLWVLSKKASCHFVTRPTQAILPLSPSHGLFGNDGLGRLTAPNVGFSKVLIQYPVDSWYWPLGANMYRC